jgi:methyl halide transferase
MGALVKPGGYLVYPLDPPTDLGPLFFVRPEHYVQSLGPRWEKVLDEVPVNSSETHWGQGAEGH